MKKFFLLSLFIFSSGSAIANQVHWTATVKWVHITDKDTAWIGLTTPSNPNPSSAEWDCANNVVWLKSKDEPAPKGMLSIALTLYATQKSVRIGVKKTEGTCQAFYLTAR